MVGFFAKADGGKIKVDVPIDVIYSDIVLRRETDDHVGFLTELNMGKHHIHNIANLIASTGNLYSADIAKMVLTGDGRGSQKNIFGKLKARREFLFNKSADQPYAFVLDGSNLNVETADLQQVATHGQPLDELNIFSGVVETQTNNFSMIGEQNSDDVIEFGSFSAHNQSDNVAQNWKINGSIYSLDKGAHKGRAILNTSVAGANKFYAVGNTFDDTSQILGLTTTNLFAPKIVVKNQSARANDSSTGAIITVAPDDVSIFPDINIGSDQSGEVLMDAVKILQYPSTVNNTSVVFCKDVMHTNGSTNPEEMHGSEPGASVLYNNHSLIQNITCQYIFLERIERRLNMLLCMATGQCQ